MTEMRVTRKLRSAHGTRLPDHIRHGDVELRHLRYFVVVAEELNLRRAAHRLEITQPALTKQVARLEEQMGVSLCAGTTSSCRAYIGGHRFPRRGASYTRAG